MIESVIRGQAVDHPGRLEALQETGLLDSLPEDSFDRYTRLAAALLEAEISLMSLVDRDRQFFKAHVGLEEPLVSRMQTPLSHSFCQHVVREGKPLVVEDARNDERVKTNLAVRDYGIIAYLGMPLATRDGHVLGSLCAIDKHARTWSPTDMKRLADLAAAVMAEIELRERTAALSQSLEHAAADEAQHKKLMRMIVHDLRTPAGAISSCLEILGSEPDDFTDEQSEILSLCKESTENMLLMIRDILDVDQLQAGSSQLSVEGASASLLLRRAVRVVRPSADEAHVEISFDFPDDLIFVAVDVRKFERVILNLLTNAIKYSPEGSTVSIRLARVEDAQGSWCRLEIADHGPGVPDAEKLAIFGEFVTGSTHSERGMQSYGIGLSFCKMVVEAHGGRLGVEDADGGGSVFYCLLPLAASPDSATTRSSE